MGLLAAFSLLGSVAEVFDWTSKSLRLQSLPAIATACGVLFTLVKIIDDKRKERDEVALSQIKESFNKVRELLKDHTQGNTYWSQACLLLYRTENLSNKIKDGQVKQKYYLIVADLVADLIFYLTWKKDKGVGVALPVLFFCGEPDWKNISNNIGLSSENNEKRYEQAALDIGSNKLDAIRPEYVVAIYNFTHEHSVQGQDGCFSVKDNCVEKNIGKNLIEALKKWKSDYSNHIKSNHLKWGAIEYIKLRSKYENKTICSGPDGKVNWAK